MSAHPPSTAELAASLGAAVALALAGCEGGREQQYYLSVVNESPRTVIVQYESWLPPAIVPPYHDRYTTAFGLLRGPIVVMDEDCRVLATFEVTAQNLRLVINREGAPSLTARDEPPTGSFLDATDLCDAPRTSGVAPQASGDAPQASGVAPAGPARSAHQSAHILRHL